MSDQREQDPELAEYLAYRMKPSIDREVAMRAFSRAIRETIIAGTAASLQQALKAFASRVAKEQDPPAGAEG